jgi:hypothetical protein
MIVSSPFRRNDSMPGDAARRDRMSKHIIREVMWMDVEAAKVAMSAPADGT